MTPNQQDTLHRLVQQHRQASMHQQHLQDRALCGLASSTRWVRDLRITANSWRYGRIDRDAVHHLFQLCPNLRRLELDCYHEDAHTLEYCSPKLESLMMTGHFDRRTTQSIAMRFRGLQSLTFGQIVSKDRIPLIAEMIQGLPNLEKLGLDNFSPKLVDEDYAQLITAGTKGWQHVELATVGPATIAALAKHCPTLEWLSIRFTYGLDDKQLVDILASCARLRTFRMFSSVFKARSLIDLEDTTTTTNTATTTTTTTTKTETIGGRLRPWLCEATLTEFRAHIGGIPRRRTTSFQLEEAHGVPIDEYNDNQVRDHNDRDSADSDSDSEYNEIIIRDRLYLREMYADESLLLQQQVLARLGRLRQLQRLQLGLQDLSAAERDAIRYNANYQPPFDDWQYQHECLEMTLASGLDQLRNLGQLRFLNIGRMATRVGSEEAEWMAQHWPRLEVLEGLCADDEFEAVWRLQTIAPHVKVIKHYRTAIRK
ncbi:hypothetical protein BGZ73_002665 [Actinomortierella ambigua]|nr:hypothetical protein BGZ73_002665 [Actinomortierella ambigua]